MGEKTFMLIQFSVENFRSVKNMLVISFAASKDKTFEERLLSWDKKKVLPALAIYGANGAGKSNILHALMTMREMVVGNASKIQKGERLSWEPCGRGDDPTRFEVLFVHGRLRFEYGFAYDSTRIVSEYLYYWKNGRKSLIFSRDGTEFVFRENVREQTTLGKRTPDNKLYLAASNDWNLPQTEIPYRWFFEKFIFSFDQGPLTAKTLPQWIIDRKAQVLKALSEADFEIVDLVLKRGHGGAPVLAALHRIRRADGPDEYVQIELDRDSSGTRSFVQKAADWLRALEEGALLVVDDIEAGLHPLLTRHLVSWFQDPKVNVNGAQLMFATPDAGLMDMPLLRTDQIWFVERKEDGFETDLYALAAFEPRQGEKVRKAYLQGRFGAIPFVGSQP